MPNNIPQAFYADLSEHFAHGLGGAIVSQVGGDEAFIKLCQQSKILDMDYQIAGMTTDSDVLAFFDKNVEALFNFTEVSSWDYRHDGGEELVLSSLEDSSYSVDDVMDILHPEDCDKPTNNELKLKIAKLVCISATLVLIRKYNEFIAWQTASSKYKYE